MASTDQIHAASAACRKLIEQVLDIQQELAQLQARSAEDSRIGVLRDKLARLQAASERQFLSAMDIFTRPR